MEQTKYSFFIISLIIFLIDIVSIQIISLWFKKYNFKIIEPKRAEEFSKIYTKHVIHNVNRKMFAYKIIAIICLNVYSMVNRNEALQLLILEAIIPSKYLQIQLLYIPFYKYLETANELYKWT